MQQAKDVEIRHGKEKAVVACTEDLSKKYPDAKQITIEVFDSVEEASGFFNEVGKDGELTVDGPEEVLSLLNSAHRANCMNKARAEHARPKSAFTELRNRVKTDPKVKARVAKLLEELELGDLDL